MIFHVLCTLMLAVNGVESYSFNDSKNREAVYFNASYVDGSLLKYASLEDEEWRGFTEAQGLYGDDIRPEITGAAHQDVQVLQDTVEGMRHKRAISAQASYYWKDAIIPFVFEDDVPEDEMRETRIAMKRHERFTCVRFVPWIKSQTRRQYDLPDESRIVLVKKKGCWAVVGNMHYRIGQKVSCCARRACVHELSHSMGVYHDHCNPTRHGWIRVNWNNVDVDQWDIFRELDPTKTLVFRYDITSHMHYDVMGFRNGPWPTMTVLFKDLAPLINLRGNVFYTWQEISETHQCKARHCPEFNIDCTNDGFVSYVENECRCICPPGLDHKTGCRTILKSVEAPSSWPDGPYGSLATSDGCPSSDFIPVDISLDTSLYGQSPHFHLAVNTTGDVFQLQTCLKESTSGSVKWQTGSYCLMAHNSCPSGFAETEIPVDGFNVSLCCRDDGFTEDPVYTPIRQPFILFPLRPGGTCQTVLGMQSTKEFMELGGKLTADKLPPDIPIEVADNNRVKVHFCYYVRSNMDCGNVLELSRNDMTAVITSPRYPDPYGPNLDCYWLIKGPPDSNILVNFEVFDVGEETCDEDYMIIRYVIPGQNAYKKCGPKLENTFRSVLNIVTFHLHSDHTGSHAGFKAEVSLVLPETHCFNQKDNGRSYRGKVSMTRDFQPCLAWDRVTECPHHMFNSRDFDGILEENYCRNPDNSFRPWCYTKTYEGQCERNYCDVCRLENVVDNFPDCETLKKEGLCEQDPVTVMPKCAKTCAVPLPAREATSGCGRPPIIADAIQIFEKHWYQVGETVTHRCPHGGDSVTRRCHSDGTWSPGNFVCGACPLDWIYHHGHCYRFFSTAMKYKDATRYCSGRRAIVSPVKTHDELQFVVSLRVKLRGIWAGVRIKKGRNMWMNSDHTVFGLDHWEKKGKPRVKDSHTHICAIINTEQSNNTLKWASCLEKRSFVCKLTPSSRRLCVNRRWDCGRILDRNPRACKDYPAFASQQCPFTCGYCDHFTTPFCSVPGPKGNVVATGDVPVRYIPRGDIITYACKPGTVLEQGDLIRVCQVNGWLSGKRPVCTDDEGLTTPNNEIALVDRLSYASNRVTYIGNNSLSRIHKQGEITQWRIYAKSAGKVCLQVWRPRPDLEGINFEFIGQNQVSTGPDRVHIVDIPALDRIQVEKGDLIGLWSPSPSSRVTFSTCEGTETPEGKDSYVLSKVMSVASYFHYSEVYGARTKACRRFSITAYVNKTAMVISRTHGAPLDDADSLISQPNRVYTGNNSYFRIRVNGSVMAWQFYSRTAVKLALQVWRHRPDQGSNKYEFIGENPVETDNNTQQTFIVPEKDRITVQENDMIGIWFGDPAGGIPYHGCYSRENKLALPLAWKRGGGPFEAESLHDFRPLSVCRVFSFVALIEPDT